MKKSATTELTKQSNYVESSIGMFDLNNLCKDGEQAKIAEYSKYMRINAKQILGLADYKQVYEFFKSNFKRVRDYDYIIVKARRAYMLARIFGVILLSEALQNATTSNVCEANSVGEDKGLVETYKSVLNKLHSDVFIYTQKFKKHGANKLLILDDIIIHGRAMSELLAYLKENTAYTMETIDVNSIVKSEDAECLSADLKQALQKVNVPSVDKPTWKRISNEIVALIQFSGQSYAAFVDSYLCDEKYVNEQEFGCKIYNIENNVRRIAKVNLDVGFETMHTDYADIWRCMRIYTNCNTDAVIKYYVAPFVSLPMVSLNSWCDYCNKYYIFANNDIQYKHTNKRDAITVYKYVSNVLAINYAHEQKLTANTTNNMYGGFGVVIRPGDNLNEPHRLTTEKLREAFTSEADNWQYMCKSRGNINININTQENKYKLDLDLDVLRELQAVVLWDDTLRDCNVNAMRTNTRVNVELLQKTLDTYFDSLHATNERRASKQMSRLKGIPLYALYVFLRNADEQNNWNLRQSDYNAFFAYVLSLWDVGIASYTVDVFKLSQGEYIGGCITDGEQAYHALMEKNSAMEVYALHLLKYQTANTFELHKKVNILEEITRNNRGEETLNAERLRNVVTYYDENQSIQELYGMYPATEKQRTLVQKYVSELHE